MKTIHAYICLAAFAALPSAALFAENGTAAQALKDVHVGVTRSGNAAGVDMTLDLDALSLKRNQRLILRPLLCGQRDTIQLQPIVVNGRNAAILYERNGSEEVDGALVANIKQEDRLVAYRARVPFQSWMDDAKLRVVEDNCGCGLTKAGAAGDATELGTLKRRIERQVAVEVPAQVEDRTNERSLSGSAFVHFPVNQTIIRPTYHQNEAELGKIVHTIEQVKANPEFRIDHVTIHGYASPEGTYESNARLAEGRAQAVARYAADLSGLPMDKFSAESTPEDWDGLVASLKQNPTAHAQEILEIINSESDPDRREYLIRQRYPQDYAQLLKDVYPLLRHSDYTVSYTLVSHTSETVRAASTATKTVVENADADVLDD